MIKIFTSVSLFLLGILAQAQTPTQTVSKFTAMEIGKNIEILYTESATPSIQVGDANVVTQIKDGILTISVGQSTNEVYQVSVFGNDVRHIKASGKISVTNQLSAPELTLILENDATFAGNIKSSKKLNLHASQNAVFNGRVETQNLNTTLNGDAKASLTGKAETAMLSADHHSVCLAQNFMSNQITVTADAYATVKIHAPNRLDVTVSEKARVTYTGNPNQFKMNENAIAVSNLNKANIAVATK